jgi:hypothetical protein
MHPERYSEGKTNCESMLRAVCLLANLTFKVQLGFNQATWVISAAPESASIESLDNLRRICRAGKF